MTALYTHPTGEPDFGAVLEYSILVLHPGARGVLYGGQGPAVWLEMGEQGVKFPVPNKLHPAKEKQKKR